MFEDTAVLESELDLPLLHRGKVRDVYEVDEDPLLMVASDRVSAFDVVLSQPIPNKGEVLTQITAWWLKQLERHLEHHLVAVDPDAIMRRHPELAATRQAWVRRSMLVTRTNPILVECVIRGYITGSAWKEYRQSGTLANEPLADGLRESEHLKPPIFSPSTKAEQGKHDENITFGQVVDLLGSDLAGQLRELSLETYQYGKQVAESSGIILADTKFEFGLDHSGKLLLIDEVLTPDSSRFWPKESYEVGRSQPSLDKQPIRAWLDALSDWDKSPPPPDLPAEVVQAAAARYEEIFQRLTGIQLADFQPPHFSEPQ